MSAQSDPRAWPYDGRQTEISSRIFRNVGRLARNLGYSLISELTLPNGRRADMVCLALDATILIVEIKSSLADFRSDTKWRNYLPFCDRFYFAFPSSMNSRLMPEDAGLIIADDYGADIHREAPLQRMSSATRRAVLIRFGRCAADRMQLLVDPSYESVRFES